MLTIKIITLPIIVLTSIINTYLYFSSKLFEDFLLTSILLHLIIIQNFNDLPHVYFYNRHLLLMGTNSFVDPCLLTIP